MNPIIDGRALILDVSAKTHGNNVDIALYRNDERLTDRKVKKYGIRSPVHPVQGKMLIFVSDNAHYEYRKV